MNITLDKFIDKVRLLSEEEEEEENTDLLYLIPGSNNLNVSYGFLKNGIPYVIRLAELSTLVSNNLWELKISKLKYSKDLKEYKFDQAAMDKQSLNDYIRVIEYLFSKISMGVKLKIKGLLFNFPSTTKTDAISYLQKKTFNIIRHSLSSLKSHKIPSNSSEYKWLFLFKDMGGLDKVFSNFSSDMTPDEIENFDIENAVRDIFINPKLYVPAKSIRFNKDRNTAEWLKAEIAAIILEGKNDKDEDEVVVETKPVVAQPSIQDRIREQAGQMSEEIDGAIDSFIMDPEAFNPKEFKMVSLLRGKGAKAAQARFIKQIFQKGYDELTELITNPDEQLREAYKHLPRKHLKKIYEFYESIFQACDQIAAEAKVMKKVRTKKVKPAEELVKKIKYKLTDDKLSIASVPAAGIIGASAVIVFNTKNRKIGIYQASSSAGLNVKGASIVDFTAKSFQKTLRKPDVQLKEFKEQNTQKRVEAWFDKIKATDTVLNGRINGEVMILKIFK